MEIETKPIYSPSKNYRWEPTDEFIFGGQEFDLLLNSVKAQLSTPEANRIIRLYEAYKILEKTLRNGVETGVIKEK